MCALLGLIKVFRWDGHMGAGGMRVGAMMNWVDGLGWGVGLGVIWGVSGVGVVKRELWIYHTALLHLSPPNPHTTPCLPHLPTTAYAPLATPHSHHLAETPIHHTHHTCPASIPPNSTPAPTLLQPTRPHPRPYSQLYVHYPTPDTPCLLPTRPTPTLQPNPSTPPYTLHISSYPPNPHPSYPYMP